MVFPKPDDAEDEYAWFCYRFWNLLERARVGIGDVVPVKLLDYHVLSLGGGPG